MLISVTRLRLCSWRYLPSFLRHTAASLGQAAVAFGLLDGRLLSNCSLVFWTAMGGAALEYSCDFG